MNAQITYPENCSYMITAPLTSLGVVATCSHTYSITGGLANQDYLLHWTRSLYGNSVLLDGDAGNLLITTNGLGEWSTTRSSTGAFDAPLGPNVSSAYTTFFDIVDEEHSASDHPIVEFFVVSDQGGGPGIGG